MLALLLLLLPPLLWSLLVKDGGGIGMSSSEWRETSSVTVGPEMSVSVDVELMLASCRFN